MQEIVVGIVVTAAIAWTVWNLYCQLTNRKKCNCADGKGRCGGSSKCPYCK